MRQNIHISQKSRLDIVNMLGKILWQNINMSPNSWQDVTNGSKNIVTNRLNFTSWKGHMMSQSILRRVDVMSQVTNCPPWSQGGQKYVDRSYRRMNVAVVNCHSRWYVGWTLSLGRLCRVVGLWVDESSWHDKFVFCDMAIKKHKIYQIYKYLQYNSKLVSLMS
jgi:hypothetical protein